MSIKVFLFWLYFYVLFELVFVAWIDYRHKKISNLWSILHIFLWIMFMIFFPEHYAIKMKMLLYPLTFFAVGFVLFALKIMGGGDSKFLATLFLIIPKEPTQDVAFTSLLIMTVVFGTISVAYNISKNIKVVVFSLRYLDIQMFKSILGRKIPFAPIIFCSWIYMGYDIRVWEFLN